MLTRPEVSIPEDRAVPGDHEPRIASNSGAEHGGKENSPLAKKPVDQAVPVPLSTRRSALLPRVTASHADVNEDAPSQRSEEVRDGWQEIFPLEEEIGINPAKPNVQETPASAVRLGPGNEVGLGSPARLKSPAPRVKSPAKVNSPSELKYSGRRKSKPPAGPSDDIHSGTTVLREADQLDTAGSNHGWKEVFAIDAETGYTPDGRASSRRASDAQGDVKVKEEAAVDGGDVGFTVEPAPKLLMGLSRGTKRPANDKNVSFNRMLVEVNLHLKRFND